MSLLNFLKKKKTIEKKAKSKGKKVEKLTTGAEDKSSSSKSFVKTRAIKPSKIKKETKIGLASRILKIPHVSEKTTDLAQNNQYAFRVFPEANKIEIKKAIKDIYSVDVVSVRIINIHKKKKRLGKIEGIKSGYKKAIVKIEKGQKIELLSR